MGLKIEILRRGGTPELKELQDGSHRIGRSSECDIVLPSSQVSKQHAMLVIRGGKAAILDLGSANGVFVNGVLVKKQRIEESDDIQIADVQLRLVPSLPTPPRDRGSRANRQSGIELTDDAQVDTGDGEAMDAPPETLQARVQLLVEQRLLIPYYAALRTSDWRVVLGTILVSVLGASVLLSVVPIWRWSSRMVEQEALGRAHAVLSQAVRENYRILSKANDFTRLTIEATEAEKGILNAYIIDPQSTQVLAPPKYFNKALNDPYSILAIKKITQDKEERVSLFQRANIWIVAQPIHTLASETGDRALAAIVIATFRLDNGIAETFEPIAEALLFSILMSLLAFFLITRMVSYPLATMGEQLDAALKGEDVDIVANAKIPELENLATIIQFAVSRAKGGGGRVSEVARDETAAEDGAFLSQLEQIEPALSDGILVIDRDKRVQYVGRVLEEMLSLRNQTARGQNIADACRDQAFAGTAVDMAESVIGSLGQSQNANLDINGIPRALSAIAHKNSTGEVRFVTIVVKMGAE